MFHSYFYFKNLYLGYFFWQNCNWNVLIHKESILFLKWKQSYIYISILTLSSHFLIKIIALKFKLGSFKGKKIEVPEFKGHSVLQYEGLGRDSLSYTEIEVVMKPVSAEGLILYNGYTNNRQGDYIAILMRQGFVEFQFDLGTGPAAIRFVSIIFTVNIRKYMYLWTCIFELFPLEQMKPNVLLFS